MSTLPLGVYVHWPFCKSKCPYCDFNSHVRDGVEQTRWRNALLTELEHAAREAPERRVETMHTHHVKPRSKGGAENLNNLETLCGRCHKRKHADRETRFGESRGATA